MDMTADAWRMLFENWPTSIPRKGMIFTKQRESIPFTEYAVANALLLLERPTPDAHGARKVVVPMDQIAALKLSGTQPMTEFLAMGFREPFVS